MTEHTSLADPPPGFGEKAGNQPDAGVAATVAGRTFLADAWADLRRRPTFIVSAILLTVMLLVALFPMAFAGWFGNGDPRVCNLSFTNGGPAPGHPFGFDTQGCDIYANVIYGARTSISIGLLVTATSALIALVLGSIAGFYGGVVDSIVSRTADVLFGFPFILGAIVILNSLPERGVVSVSLVLALFSWPAMTRLMRASVLSTIGSDYVLAARGLGATDLRIVRKHVLPNSIAPLIIQSTISIGAIIGAEATLTFLGVGLQLPAISWGLQLSNAQATFQLHPHLVIFPGLFLAITAYSFIALGDTLRDALDTGRS